MADVMEDPLVSFHYKVDIGGMVVGYFTECSGLDLEYEGAELKIVSDKGVPVTVQQPGRVKFTDITLKRGITDSLDIWDWRKLVEDGKIAEARVNGSIVLCKQDTTPVTQWNFERGWPSKVSGPKPKSDSNEIGVEEIVIVHEYIERVGA